MNSEPWKYMAFMEKYKKLCKVACDKWMIREKTVNYKSHSEELRFYSVG